MVNQAKDEWPDDKEVERYAAAHNPALSQAMQFLSYITTTIQLYVTVTGATWAVVSSNTLGVGNTALLWILAMHVALSVGVALGLLGMGNSFIQRLNFAQWLGVTAWPHIVNLGGGARAWAGIPSDDTSKPTVKTFEEWRAGRQKSGVKSRLPLSLERFFLFTLHYRAFQWPSLRFQRLWFLVPLLAACFSAWLFVQVRGESATHKALCEQVSATLSFPDDAPVAQGALDLARYFFDKAGCSVDQLDIARFRSQRKQALDPIEGRVANVERTLGAVAGDIDKLKNLDDLAKQLGGDVASLDEKKAAAQKSAEDAASAARSARQSAESTENSRASIMKAVDDLNKGLGSLEEDTGAATARLQIVKSNLDKAENANREGAAAATEGSAEVQAVKDRTAALKAALADIDPQIQPLRDAAAKDSVALGEVEGAVRTAKGRLEGSVETRLETIERALSGVETRIKADEAPVPPPPAPPSQSSTPPSTLKAASPQSEAGLDQSGWRRIQRALAQQNDCNCNPGDADGLPGGNTRRAIKAFQAKIHAKTDGRLTWDQIAGLWSAED